MIFVLKHNIVEHELVHMIFCHRAERKIRDSRNSQNLLHSKP